MGMEWMGRRTNYGSGQSLKAIKGPGISDIHVRSLEC